MNIKKIVLVMLLLPVTILLDFVLFAFMRTCPSCGSFSQFVQTEGALSFPIIVGLMQWLEIKFKDRR